MSAPAIRVSGLGKRYRIGERVRYKSLRETISNAVTRTFRGGRRAEETIWALKDVSFEVAPGEVVGVIGRNGAGKSTLLKILSRITEPTEGRVELHGRVGSLLEVGTGFHLELTGRENIYLNGAILGMKRAEIDRKFDEIIAFAEIERFLDTPVKHYSTGMYLRLAFAVAAHLEPEILLVDEVLAVGDSDFQKKCLGKMGDVARGGRTVIFVSHNMAAVENLCDRALVLSQGGLMFEGDKSDAITQYLRADGHPTDTLRDRRDRVGSGDVRFVGFELRDVRGTPLTAAHSGQDVDIVFFFETRGGYQIPAPRVSVGIKTPMDAPVFLHHSRLTRDEFGPLPPRGAFVFRVQRLPLPPATYKIDCSAMVGDRYLDLVCDAAELTVVAGDYYRSGEVPPSTHGVCLVDGRWRIIPAEVSGQPGPPAPVLPPVRGGTGG